MSTKTLLTFLFACFTIALHSQVITFKNPSFEGTPKHSTLPTIYLGQPHLHSLLQMLQYYPESSWKMVIHHDDPAVLQQRFLEISKLIPDDLQIPLTVSTYHPELYVDAKWFSKSVKNGLYLLRKQ